MTASVFILVTTVWIISTLVGLSEQSTRFNLLAETIHHTELDFQLADGNVLSIWIILTTAKSQRPTDNIENNNNNSCVQMDLMDQNLKGQQNVRLWFDHDRNLYKCLFRVVDIGQPAATCDLPNPRSTRTTTSRSINLRDLSLQTTKELHEKCRQLQGEQQPTDHGLRRQKRSDAFIMPGTRWCGRGGIHSPLLTFNEEIESGMCCLPYVIHVVPTNHTRLTKKYGHYNTSPATLSLCECDDRFLECLENAGTYAANRVGTIYFNLFKIPCFRRFNRTVCVEQSDVTGECMRRTTRSIIELYQSQKSSSPGFEPPDSNHT
ncbi:Phospholipase A2 isozyme PA4 [Fasciola gigantica]|uniref:Phospholipase A2 isozyme PA4 n=1 Tax=Fasciola gigantica TaxID=46835 RepID=A0A504YYC7_FASGI|nr:Phospholipase A2 isozyme PA4 [Fasciola gigantica]